MHITDEELADELKLSLGKSELINFDLSIDDLKNDLKISEINDRFHDFSIGSLLLLGEPGFITFGKLIEIPPDRLRQAIKMYNPQQGLYFVNLISIKFFCVSKIKDVTDDFMSEVYNKYKYSIKDLNRSK